MKIIIDTEKLKMLNGISFLKNPSLKGLPFDTASKFDIALEKIVYESLVAVNEDADRTEDVSESFAEFLMASHFDRRRNEETLKKFEKEFGESIENIAKKIKRNMEAN